MRIYASLLGVLANVQLLLVFQPPYSCFAQQQPNLQTIFGDLGLTPNATAALFSSCQVELLSALNCTGFNQSNSEQRDPEQSALLGRCTQCLQSELGANATNTTQPPAQLACEEVAPRVDAGFDACSSTCEVDGCVDTLSKFIRCFFNATVNCTTGGTKFPLVSSSQSPVAAPSAVKTPTSGAAESSPSTPSTGAAPAPPPASDAMSTMLWFSAASLGTIFAFILMIN